MKPEVTAIYHYSKVIGLRYRTEYGTHIECPICLSRYRAYRFPSKGDLALHVARVHTASVAAATRAAAGRNK